jgi:hypothetical protein
MRHDEDDTDKEKGCLHVATVIEGATQGFLP